MLPLSEHGKYNNELFKRYAPFYDSSELILAHVREKVVAEIEELPFGSQILDVACGTGSQSIAIARAGMNVTGVDISPDMLAVASKKVDKKLKNKVAFINADATKLPFKGFTFDASVITFSIHDMPEPVASAVLSEMKRVTKPNGKIIVVDYNAKARNRILKHLTTNIPRLWESKYFVEFLKKGIKYHLDKAGLTIISQKTFYGKIVKLTVCRK